jgi:hypothetical protein
LYNGLQALHEEAIERRVLEATLVRLCERCADREGDDNIIGVLGGAARGVSALRPMCFAVEAFDAQMQVAGTHMADNALVEGAICETIDLRRSVIFATGIDNL